MMRDKSEQKKGKKRKIGSVIVVVACLAAIAIALAKIIPIQMDYKKSIDKYAKMNEDYVQGSVDEGKPDWWAEDVEVELAKLHERNPDVIAWIRFDNQDNIPISYPLLYSGDDDQYLRRDIDGEYLISGSIFLAGASNPDFSDYHDIIYGHNMRNDTMFGGLKKYVNDDGFYEENQYFTIYTETKAYRYQIFSFHEVSAYSDIYQIGFGPDETYEAYLNTLISSSVRDTGVYPTKEDRTITLSTCSPNGESIRTVLHAVRIDEREYQLPDVSAGE